MSSFLKRIATGRKDVFFLRHQDIDVEDGFNARLDFNTPEDDDLYEFLRHGGDIPPLRGHKVGDKFILTDGERRWRQIGRLNHDHGEKVSEDEWQPWAQIPVLADPRGEGELDRLSRMIAANQGKALTLLEKGDVWQRMRLLDETLTTEQIAHRSGCTRTAVEDGLTLVTRAHGDLFQAVRRGRIAATLAVKIIRHAEDEDQQATLLQMAERNARDSGADRITEKHFGDHLKKKRQEELAPPVETPTDTESETGNREPQTEQPQTEQPETEKPDNSYAYDSAEEGDDDPADNRDRTCPKCQALLADSDTGPECWRCRDSKHVQPDDTETGTPEPKTGNSEPGTGSSASSGSRERPLSSSGGDTGTFEPPPALDEKFLSGLLQDAPSTSTHERRLAIGYLVAHLRGEVTRSQLVQFLKEGRIDP